MDVATTTEQTTPEAPAAAPVDDSLSLSDHEAQYGGALTDAEPEPGAPDTADGRDQRGRYKSKSSRATAEDVPRIQALTKEKHTLVAERDALKAERDALKSTAPAVTPPPQAGTAAPRVQPVPASSQAPQAIPQQFPTYEAFVAIPGYEQATYEDYVDARADWRFALRRAAEREQEAAEKAQRDFHEKASSHLQRVQAARTKYPDFDTVVNAPDLPPITYVMRDAILASKQSEEIQYYLGTHRDALAELVAESQDYSQSAVASMRRYLETLITPSTPARNVAATTGSALALVPPPAPRPPNPVRTGTQAQADAPPGDEDGLAAHEKHYGRKRR